MEVASTNVHKGIKGYWNRRRGYEKLNATTNRRLRSTRFGVVDHSPTEPSASHRKRRFSWRIKLTRKLKFTKFKYVCSPKKFLLGLRDAYVNLMNRIANCKVIADGIGGGFGGGAADSGFGGSALKEYDEKMIIEIYKSIIIAHGQLVPHREAQRIGS